ncbi:MAG: hypothetical protein LIP01_14870 [Tannerellaceae bacterium]|nr:hypothetical protein [Tannerellaceae bacterium]
MIEGHAPREISQDSKYVITRSMADKYNLTLGWYNMHVNDIYKREITGICEDINLTSLRQSDYNLLFVFDTDDYQPYSYIRIKAGSDYTAAVNHIRTTLKAIDPAYPVEIKFYDEYLMTCIKKRQI